MQLQIKKLYKLLEFLFSLPKNFPAHSRTNRLCSSKCKLTAAQGKQCGLKSGLIPETHSYQKEVGEWRNTRNDDVLTLEAVRSATFRSFLFSSKQLLCSAPATLEGFCQARKVWVGKLTRTFFITWKWIQNFYYVSVHSKFFLQKILNNILLKYKRPDIFLKRVIWFFLNNKKNLDKV